MGNKFLRRTWAEVDLHALSENYKKMRAHLGAETKFLGVVKANAYGHGAVQVSKKLEELGADYLAVATLDEARELREAEVKLPILILGHTPMELTSELIKYDITQAVSNYASAAAYNAVAELHEKPLKIHINVDTGMSRLGYLVRGERFERGVSDIAKTCALPWLDAEGIFTHFAVSDENDTMSESYTREQFDLFMHTIEALEAQGKSFVIRHCANSGAFVHYPEMHLDMVRPGLALYGAGIGVKELSLTPAMELKSCIYAVKYFEAGGDIGYGRTYHADQKARLGVLPAGYADGFSRGFSNKVSVLTDQGPAPIRGRVCMDMTMVDLSDLPDVQVGDEVEIFGHHQTVDELAAMLKTIPNEILCAVGKRVPRVYSDSKE